ncbi:MAG: hypothetical protein AAGF24_11485 [Cyanobacteria bacterium P01_H01_bin.121]
MFVLQRGAYAAAKMEYSDGRRAQSVTQTLHWKDVAIIDTELLQEAVSEAQAAINEWQRQGFTAKRWRVEGRGSQITKAYEF